MATPRRPERLLGGSRRSETATSSWQLLVRFKTTPWSTKKRAAFGHGTCNWRVAGCSAGAMSTFSDQNAVLSGRGALDRKASYADDHRIASSGPRLERC